MDKPTVFALLTVALVSVSLCFIPLVEPLSAVSSETAASPEFTPEAAPATQQPEQAKGSAALKDAKKHIRFYTVKMFSFDAFSDVIADYEALHPDVVIERIELPEPNNSSELHQFLLSALAAKSDCAEIYTPDCIWFPELAEAGFIDCLDDVYDEDEKGSFFPGVIDALTYDGHLYGAPWYFDNGLLYYRTDLLEKYSFQPPETWDELIEQAVYITKREPDPQLQGFVFQGKRAEVLTCNFNEFLSKKSDVLDGEGNAALGKGAVRAAQLMYDLIYKYAASPREVLQYDEQPTLDAFASGNAVFMRNWNYAWNELQNAEGSKKSKVAGRVGCVPLPSFDGSSSAACMGGFHFALKKGGPDRAAAVDFLRYLSSESVVKDFALKMSIPPVRIALLQDADICGQLPFFVEIRDVFSALKPRPKTKHYPQVSDVIQAELSKLLAQQQTPEQAIENMQSGIESAINAELPAA